MTASTKFLSRARAFVDFKRVRIQAGRGGDGCISFQRSSRTPFGPADGGSGGRGGSVYVSASKDITSLNSIQTTYAARHGEPGRGNGKHGAAGSDVELTVPIGTTVKEIQPSERFTKNLDGFKPSISVFRHDYIPQPDRLRFLLERAPPLPPTPSTVDLDLTAHGERHLLARAGRGEAGYQTFLELELKTIADCGLVGMPNAGKSTLLSAISNAHPKIGPYPFTTLNPYIGAHLNKGLGHAFLRHVERSKVLVYVIDASGPAPWHDLATLKYELEMYRVGLTAKPSVVIANKADLDEAQANMERLRHEAEQCTIVSCSARERQNIMEVTGSLRRIMELMVRKSDSDTLADDKISRHIDSFIGRTMHPIKWRRHRLPNEILYDIFEIILSSDMNPYEIRNIFRSCSQTCKGFNHIATQFLYERLNATHEQVEAPVSFFESKYFATYDYDCMMSLGSDRSVDGGGSASSDSLMSLSRVRRQLPLVKSKYNHPMTKIVIQIEQWISSLKAVKGPPLATNPLLVFNIMEDVECYDLTELHDSRLYDLSPPIVSLPRSQRSYELLERPEWSNPPIPFYRQRPFQFVKSLGIHLSELNEVIALSSENFPNLTDLWLVVDRDINLARWGLPRQLAELKLSFGGLTNFERSIFHQQGWEWVAQAAPNLQSLVLHHVRSKHEVETLNKLIVHLALKSFALMGYPNEHVPHTVVASTLNALGYRCHDTIKSLYLKNCNLIGISEDALTPLSASLTNVFLNQVRGGTQLLTRFGRLQVFEATHWEGGNVDAVMKANVKSLKSLCICQSDGQSLHCPNLMQSAVMTPVGWSHGPESNITSLAITTKQAHRGRFIDWLKKYGGVSLQQLYIYHSLTLVMSMHPSHVSAMLSTITSACINLKYLHVRNIPNPYLITCLHDVISKMGSMRRFHYEKEHRDANPLDGDLLLKAVQIRREAIINNQLSDSYCNGVRGPNAIVLKIVGQGSIAFSYPYCDKNRTNSQAHNNGCTYENGSSSRYGDYDRLNGFTHSNESTHHYFSSKQNSHHYYQNGLGCGHARSPMPSPSATPVPMSLTTWVNQRLHGLVSFHGVDFVKKV
ncbi:hypothetical protein SeMB42_g04794 [Synchytrium endobioticum]|uniref:Obg family GTPase CgtA n=1 Tax=Synchytrium endobioticum TaxID=286115 RepID=A0A507CW31_9FUNG|nr:hypothetical protein SeMB42_g04794 [Synchytrium endobioticum]